jgi:hypothetical protein
LAIAGLLLLLLATTVAATLWQPLGSPPLLIQSDHVQVGDVSVRLEEAAIAAMDESSLSIRALGLQPHVSVEWRGSGDDRPFAVRIENLNLRTGRLTLSPASRERARHGSTVELTADLVQGPLEASVAIAPETAATGHFAVVGCTRSNRLIAPILHAFAEESPLFVVHLGDVGMGTEYESEALRRAFDQLGIPLFVAPGNHDHDPLPPKALNNFHRHLNPAPFTFALADQLFAVLDVSDYPVARGQLAALERDAHARSVGRVWFFLHRSPIDPFGTDRELPPDSAGSLEALVASADDARTYVGHIQGFAQGTFGGHPYVLSSGGGEATKEEADGFRDPDPYHYVVVPLDGSAPQRRSLPAPSWLAGQASRASIELPIFGEHLWAGVAADGVVLALWLWRRRLPSITAGSRRESAVSRAARAAT